ncbi:hypothetical protein [Thiomonas sp.]|jgi:hypothetical protein|uniref:hypothetical protein n=1 Tax=Thiomonas sp. TaxID=2047785 RepID=UPI00263909F6|nr:hypothetical protein [Thiomonas sp.]
MTGKTRRRKVLEGTVGQAISSGDAKGATRWPLVIMLSQAFLSILAWIAAPFTMSPTDLGLAVSFGYGAVLGGACYAWFSRKLVGRRFAGRYTPLMVLSPGRAKGLAAMMALWVIFGQASLMWAVLSRVDTHPEGSTGELVAKSRDRVRSGICRNLEFVVRSAPGDPRLIGKDYSFCVSRQSYGKAQIGMRNHLAWNESPFAYGFPISALVPNPDLY